MKKVLIPAVMLMLALTGCASKHHHKAPVAQSTTTTTTTASTDNVQIDARKEVSYLCGTGNDKNSLRVMYGLQGQNVVAAQVNYQGKLSPVMIRDARDVNYNTFVSPEGITWKTALATSDTVDTVGALGLVQPSKQVVNGQERIVPQIVTQNCVVDNGTVAAAPAKTKTVRTTKTVTTKKVYKHKK
ncbi:MAG: hypothetical protein J6578_06965 [Snodgrassella sp.]|uniref:Lipoprotein n=1 Tax=Snodgrassella alvi TaxID=1196083 RepID=A0A2N9XR39_9NEIS|nr:MULTISPECIES: hypothetical protein [Snodgrassella]MCO6508516.1 hypothetical protein [Snodgrassella sp.]MCO6515676.1 hypothetical protein [Snodgrassella sp.]PIT50794.1 hypothetical protein BHC48_05745 [Snodgrassella communis]